MESSRPKAKPSDDVGAPPPPPPPPPEMDLEKRGGFLGLFGRKKGKVAGSAGGVEESMDNFDMIEKRIAWEKQENQNAETAHLYGKDYVRKPLPPELRDAAYDEEENHRIEMARLEHERDEMERMRYLGDDYVARPFVAPGQEQPEEEAPPPPPPPAEDDGALAEILGTKAYGGGQDAKAGFYKSGQKMQDIASANAAPLTSAPARAMPVAPKVGWAGIFDTRRGPPAPNPFKGTIVHPQVSYAASSVPVMQEKGIAGDIAQRLNEGRELATLALNNHESAPTLAAKGLVQEARAAYHAADAGYDQALRSLMPLRKALENGPESSRPARVREAEKLEKLITKILDHWEEVKPHLIPDVPSVPLDVPQPEERDPLLDRLSMSMAHLEPRPDVFTDTGELNLDALPSIPKDDVPGVPQTKPTKPASSKPGRSSPKFGGPKSCYVCSTATSKTPAELVTPCNHYLCTNCTHQMFGLFPGQCPECSGPCKKEELKAIA